MANGEWQRSKDENVNELYTWKDFVVKKERRSSVTSASYLNPGGQTIGESWLWVAIRAGSVVQMNGDPTALMEYCEQLDSYAP